MSRRVRRCRRPPRRRPPDAVASRDTAPAQPLLPARPVAGPHSPREACGDRSQFALYRCMQTQCASSLWHGHAQCQRLRESDQVD